MEVPAVDHLLRTMAAVPTDRRVLLRGADDGRVARPLVRPLARMGFEVHAAPWSDAAARRVQEAAAEVRETKASPAPVYATAAPLRALPYPEAHFGWVVARVPHPEGASDDELREVLEAVLDEARHHLRPGGWVFVLAPGGPAAFAPEALDETATRAGLARAEPPERADALVHAIYRRVDPGTPL